MTFHLQDYSLQQAHFNTESSFVFQHMRPQFKKWSANHYFLPKEGFFVEKSKVLE